MWFSNPIFFLTGVPQKDNNSWLSTLDNWSAYHWGTAWMISGAVIASGYKSQLPFGRGFFFIFVRYCRTQHKFLCTGVSASIQQKLTVHRETPCSTVTQFGLAWWAKKAQILQAPCLQHPDSQGCCCCCCGGCWPGSCTMSLCLCLSGINSLLLWLW